MVKYLGYIPILEYYKNQFDCVYIILHPFLKLKNEDQDIFQFNKYPSKHEIIEHCEELSWKEVLSQSSLNSLSEIDQALKAYICSIKKNQMIQKFENELVSFLEKTGIYPPLEDYIPVILENDLLTDVTQHCIMRV